MTEFPKWNHTRKKIICSWGNIGPIKTLELLQLIFNLRNKTYIISKKSSMRPACGLLIEFENEITWTKI